ncbi:hypothetical protein GCM10009559_22330 [Pseudonocardia zijingensis]|uniref:CAAX prenyl protease 2/Lysostaphin resistance protein A-like domain-containing protein n=1 Tax=Pseudonocardia zijingensis TaxID=153376 RepID=A0ABN1PTG9_9PSEU
MQSNGQPEQEGAPIDPAQREADPHPSASDAAPDAAPDDGASRPVPADTVPAAPQNGAALDGAALHGTPQSEPPHNGAPQNGASQNGAPHYEAPHYEAAQYGTAQYGAVPTGAPAPYAAPPPPYGYGAPPPPYGGPAAPPSSPVAPFPPPPPTAQQAPGQQAPVQGWPYPGPGGPHAGPSYPPGPYPPTGPYPAPSIGRSKGPVAAWGAPAPVRTHRWGLGAYLFAEAVFLLVGGLISAYVLLSGTQPGVGVLVAGLAAPTLLAAGTALLITRLRGNGPRADLRLEWSWRDVGIGLVFGFGGLVLTIPASIVYVSIVGDDASSAVGDVFGGIRAGPLLAALVLVLVVIVAPMCEEILYRGLLWGGLEKIGGRWVAFAVSTLLFALAHFEFTRTPLLLVVAIPIAIARLYTGRLLASIVAHQVNNLLPGIALVLGLLGIVPMA